jgi:hypothetical protein
MCFRDEDGRQVDDFFDRVPLLGKTKTRPEPRATEITPLRPSDYPFACVVRLPKAYPRDHLVEPEPAAESFPEVAEERCRGPEPAPVPEAVVAPRPAPQPALPPGLPWWPALFAEEMQGTAQNTVGDAASNEGTAGSCLRPTFGTLSRSPMPASDRPNQNLASGALAS